MLERNKKDEKMRMQVVKAIADLRSQINITDRYCNDMFEDAVNAAKQGFDDLADEFIEATAYYKDFLNDLKKLEMRVVAMAKGATVFESLHDLPKVVSACNSIIVSAPNLKALGRSMADLDSKFAKMRADIKKIATSKRSNNSDLLEKVFGDTPAQDKKIKKSVADLKAALVQRVAADGNMPNDALNKAANNTNRFQNK